MAFAITFDAPSYRTLMLIVRLMVQRYRRMPAFLSIDGGREFWCSAEGGGVANGTRTRNIQSHSLGLYH